MLIDLKTWKKGWSLLEKQERRTAWLTLFVVIFAALSSAVMVGSVMPFLAVLAEPDTIDNVAILSWLNQVLGFNSDFDFIVALGVASFSVIIFTTLIQVSKNYIVARFTMMRMHSISRRLLDIYLSQPYSFYLGRHSGDLSTRVLAESEKVVTRFFRPAAELIASGLTVVSILILLMLVEPVISLIAFAVLGGCYSSIFLLTRKYIRDQGRIRASKNSKRYQVTTESIRGVKEIKVLGREHSYVSRYSDPSLKIARAETSVLVLSSIPQLALQAIAFGGIILLCLVLVDAEGLESGAALGGILPVLGLFAFAGQRMLPELSRLYRSLVQLQAGAAAVDAVHDDLVTLRENVKPNHPDTPKLPFEESITIDALRYTYPSAKTASLRDISFSILKGERVGIVGATGAGKTTLIDVILGLLEPEHGQLVADSTVVADENLSAWRKCIGYVPQNIFLSDATLAENIAIGIEGPQIDQTRVEEAAKTAHVHDFISNELPHGYGTLAGEQGVRLSGGQRQRVGIARALYDRADVIVFDEATSALDNATEADVIDAVLSLPGDKTILMIAHRLSTLLRCDKILVLANGKLAGMGSWDELEANCPEFQAILTSSALKD